QREDQQSNLGRNTTAPEIKQFHDEVADGDALQDAVEPHVSEMKVRKAVDHNPEDHENRGAPHRMQGKLLARFAASQPRLRRKYDRDSDDKKKGGKYEIGGRKAVPCGVMHLGPCVSPTIVVHHDHEGDGEAPQNVEGKQSLF